MLSALPEDLSLDLRRRLRIVKGANEHRRLVAIAMLVKGHSVSAIARLLGAARSSVNRWRQRFLGNGLDGLRNDRTGRRRRLCRDKLATFLLALVETSPPRLELPAQPLEFRANGQGDPRPYPRCHSPINHSPPAP